MAFNLFPTNLVNFSTDSSTFIHRGTSIHRGSVSIEDKIDRNEAESSQEKTPETNSYEQYGGKIVKNDEHGTIIEYALASIYDKNTEEKEGKETEREDISGQRDIWLNLPELPDEFKKYMQYKIVKVNINRTRNRNKNRIPDFLGYSHKNKTREYLHVYEGVKDYLKEELGKQNLQNNRMGGRTGDRPGTRDKIEHNLGNLEDIVETEIGDGSIVFENGEKYGLEISDSEEVVEVYKKFRDSEFAQAAVKYGLKEMPEFDGYASLDLGDNVLAAVITYGDKEILAVNKRYQKEILNNQELYNRIFVHEAIHRLGNKSEYSTRLKEKDIYDRIANDKDIGEIEKMLGGRYSCQVGMELQNPKSYEMN